MIEVRGLRVDRGRRPVLQDISLTVPTGSLTALIGPNGAGKSTLLAAVAGDLRAAQGTIRLGGDDVGSLHVRELARRRAVYRQSRSGSPGFLAHEIVGMALRRGDVEAVRTAMAATDTAHLAHRLFATLSEGERARVVLARTFAQGSPVLLLDEPTASLDLRHQYQVLAQLRRRADEGAAIMVAVHDIGLAAQFADDVVIVSEGRVVAAGPPVEVIEEATIEAVFGMPVRVVPHPLQPVPMVIPVTGEMRDAD